MHRQLCSFLPALGPLAVAQRFICAAFAVIGLLVGVAPRTASAQATSDLTRRTDPYFNMIYVPCSGETVALSGQMVETYHDVREPSGNVQGIIEFRLSDVTGIGTPSGAVYRASGPYASHFNVSRGESVTDESTFVLIGPGQLPNILVSETRHLTVTPDGSIVTSFDKSHTECVG